MIAYLKGQIRQKLPSQVVLDIGGVGYSAWIPLSTFLTLGDIGETAELIIHTHMSDSSLLLCFEDFEGVTPGTVPEIDQHLRYRTENRTEHSVRNCGLRS